MWLSLKFESWLRKLHSYQNKQNSLGFLCFVSVFLTEDLLFYLKRDLFKTVILPINRFILLVL